MNPDNKHQPSADDFDYLANKGFEKTPFSEADLEDIQQRIDKKVGSTRTNIPKGRIITAIALLSTATVLWYTLYYGNGAKNKTPDPHTAITSETPGAAEQTVVTDSVVKNEPTISISKKENTVYPKEHFTKENTGVHFTQDISPEILPSHNITNIETTNELPTQKQVLELLPNAPVIYLFNLKVSDYQQLYFKKNEPFNIKNGGLSSDYENITGYKSVKNKEEPVYTADMVLKDALVAFNKQDYPKSISLFSILLELNKKDVNALFYSALSFYHNNNHPKALAFLDKVLDNENNVFDQEAEWYKAQALLKTNNKEAALELLLKINSRKGFYSDKAADKLKEVVH